jgi:hypothetical protein
MLTKFLLDNRFPANCFFTPKGAVNSYQRMGKSVKVFFTGGQTTYAITETPFKTIYVPKELFQIHIKIYKKLIKELKTTNMLELLNSKGSKKDSWEEALTVEIMNNLAGNIVFPMALQGEITHARARGTYNLAPGEVVYIESSDNSHYNTRTVDNLTVRIKKEHIQIFAPTTQVKQVEKWKKTLETIEAEYEEFIKNN